MFDPSDEVVVPFATFLEVRERRRRVSESLKQPVHNPFSDDSPPAAAVAVALPREAVSAARSGLQQDESTISFGRRPNWPSADRIDG